MSHQVEREAVVSSKSNLENSGHIRHRFDDVKKDFEAADSGYLSAPNITCSLSDIGHSSSDIGITDSRSKFDEQKKATTAFDPSADSGVIDDTREDDSNYHSHQSNDEKMFITSDSGLVEKFSDLQLENFNQLDDPKPKQQLSRSEIIELLFSQDEDGDT